MSAMKNTADTTKKNNTKGGEVSDAKGRYSESSDAKDDSSEESKGKDPLAVSQEEAVSGAEEKNQASTTEDKDGASTKNKASIDTQQKDPESKENKNDSSAIAEGKETAPSTKKGSSEGKERAKSLLMANESPSGPKDLFYLFQKYADEEESTKSTDKITSKLLKKWLGQAKLFDKEAGITEAYTTDLFEKSASETDTIDFEEFQTFLYRMAEEKKQSYSELMHKILSAGKPHVELSEPEDLQKAIKNSMKKNYSTESPEGQSKEESESEFSDSSNKTKE
ncbi:hypothetical protein AVEN_108624-1 [Araneus ventricosus]|uniref:EF-hand domain-containing protein n=1 Tax=Araneus ventricosus TaxID=182803 RepID=A0A4Y2DJ46_ARAVE|nr:hypothetical protein AVEN_108624-1 [Araneus ventricosus]